MIEWLQAHLLPCVFSKYFNFECPGCGTQRALIFLLKGEFINSIKQFPALIPYLITLLLMVLQLIFKTRNGGLISMYAFIVSVSVMVVNYVVKLIF